MDFTEGIRQENADTVMVFPAKLQVLTEQVDKIIDYNANRQVCFCCGVKSENLKRCSKCQEAYYCSKDCQIVHWKKTHKKLCQHMETLSQLAKFDFSHFTGCIDWSFVRPDTQSSHLHNETLYDLAQRSCGVEQLSKSQRLLTVLNRCKDLVLQSDSVSSRILSFISIWDIEKERDEFIHPLSQNSLFSSFLSLASNFSGDGNNKKYFVVDLKSSSVIEDTFNDVFLSVMFLSLPQWQEQAGILGINWCFEYHWVLQEDLSLFSSSWDMHMDIDGLLAMKLGSQAFYHDNMKIVVDIANAIAKQKPDEIVVLVLRPSGETSNFGYIQDIVLSELPENILTLWIREDLFAQGCKFNDPRPEELSLLDQLQDFTNLWM